MPLTREEREFLDAYAWEMTHEPFGGLATDDLRRRSVYYPDLQWLLTAYHREASARGASPMGKHNPVPPASPWLDSEHARLRNLAVRDECQREGGRAGNGEFATAGRDDELANTSLPH